MSEKQSSITGLESTQMGVHWFMQGILVAGSLLFVVGAVKLIIQLSVVSVMVSVILVGIAWFFWAMARSRAELHAETILVKVPYGTFQTRWDEITKIVTNGTLYSLQSGKKCLSISTMLAEKNKVQFCDLLETQAEMHGIAIEYSNHVPVRHKNTRIR